MGIRVIFYVRKIFSETLINNLEQYVSPGYNLVSKRKEYHIMSEKVRRNKGAKVICVKGKNHLSYLGYNEIVGLHMFKRSNPNDDNSKYFGTGTFGYSKLKLVYQPANKVIHMLDDGTISYKYQPITKDEINKMLMGSEE